MKKFKVTCIKTAKILGPGQNIAMMTEQEYITDNPGININVPEGYQCMAVVEILPTLKQFAPVKLKA